MFKQTKNGLHWVESTLLKESYHDLLFNSLLVSPLLVYAALQDFRTYETIVRDGHVV
jgi:hypothetical protein